MKKVLIVYITIFLLTIIVPVIVCFALKSESDSNELVNIFRQNLNLIPYYC